MESAAVYSTGESRPLSFLLTESVAVVSAASESGIMCGRRARVVSAVSAGVLRNLSVLSLSREERNIRRCPLTASASDGETVAAGVPL